MFGFLRTKPGRHLSALNVAGAEVVHHDERTDGVEGFRWARVAQCGALSTKPISSSKSSADEYEGIATGVPLGTKLRWLDM